ncbi:MAG: hypothetical protein AAGB93_00005 [Planctomycetota bacterium]
MNVTGRYAVMLDRHLDSPQYEGRWPIVLIRDSLEDAVDSCGATFVRVHRSMSRREFEARRIAPFALVDGQDGSVLDGAIYLMSSARA